MNRMLQWAALALCLAAIVPLPAEAQIGPGPFAAFPTGDPTDGRMLSFGCAGSATFDERVQMTLSADPGDTDITLSIFDGDTGGVDGLGANHWDTGTRQLIYRLYFDPTRSGNENPADLVGEWFGNSPNSIINPDPDPEKFWIATDVQMPNNNWWGVTFTLSNLAQAPSGNYFYHLVIEQDGTCATGEQLVSDIKIAATGPMNFYIPRFGFEASLRNPTNTGPIIYQPFIPISILSSTTTYDGTFEIFLNVADDATDLSLFDGDFDHGTGGLSGIPSGVALSPCADTNDLDTDDAYAGFPFAPAGANNEGAVATGAPADDSAGDLFRRGEPGNPNRVGCVRYEVIDPNGVVYRNDNPSGNLEWEQFRIAAAFATNPNDADYGPAVAADGSTFVNTNLLPGGVWTVRLVGLDMSNLNFWFIQEEVCATVSTGGGGGPSGDVLGSIAQRNLAAGDPFCVGATYLLGDTVWLDTNANGVQDAGENGVAGVVVNLLDPSGIPVRSVTTGDTSMADWDNCVANNTGLDTDGLYCFGIDDPGSYTIEIARENFLAGGVLEDLSSTTGGDEQTNTVSTDNVLTYDFGYNALGSIGDYVWYDQNSNGLQDDAPDGGIGGVTINLTEAGPDGNFGTADDVTFPPQVTDDDGGYDFTDLPTGLYRVDVDESTLPDGLTLTTANEPLDVTLGVGEDFDDADFGYVSNVDGRLGDLVWLDNNANGVQDSGEAGIDGVTMTLFADIDGDGLYEFTATTSTTGGGGYQFTDLPPGTYLVTVDPATLPAGVTQTYDLDGLGTADQSTQSLALAQVRDDVDFGYRGTASLGDRIWLDNDGDGNQEAGEPGINGVTVELVDGGGNVIATQTTTGDGNYTFNNLPAGTYTVRVVPATLPAGVAQTFDLDGLGSPNQATATLAAGQNRTDVDFGYRGTGSVGDRVWVDGDGDGVQDSGEAGINGVTVELLDAGGNVIATQMTSGDGNYLFSNLAGGSYSVRVASATLPAGLTQTFDLDGTGTANIASFSLAGGENKIDVDFGYRGNGALGDRVWIDYNGDGVQDGNEPGINGVTVNLIDAGGTVIDSATTTGDGNYLFNNLAAGTYTVQVDGTTLPAGLVQTFDLDGLTTPNEAAASLAAGATRLDVDFGYRGTGSIGDRVWTDTDGDGVQDGGESGINGVTVTLFDGNGNVVASASTTGDGSYLFTDLPPGDYTVVVDPASLPAGVTQTFDLDGLATPNQASLTLGQGEDRLDVDFGYRADGDCVPVMVRDDFNQVSYDENTGVDNWSGPWVESDPAGGGPASGRVRINGGFLFMDDVPDSGTEPSVAREVDISGTTRATLRFNFDTSSAVDHDDAVTVEVSDDGGATWTTLEVITGITGSVTDTRTFDITGFISDQTQVRFRVSNKYGGSGEFFCLNWVEITAVCDDGICPPDIDFETDAHGNALVAGQIIDDEWASLGITVSSHNQSTYPAMIFDSSNPTGGDYDLGTPNQDFGGPGVGSGGRAGTAGENSQAQGKILIVSEDGDQSDPDDRAAGGTLIFTFATPVEIDSVTILDIDGDEAMGTVKTFDASNTLITSSTMQPLGNNSFQVVPVGASGVSKLKVAFPKSGGVAGITFCPADEVCVEGTQTDPTYHNGSNDHAVWMPGISEHLLFDPTGSFVEDAVTGTATLTGTLVDRDDPSKRLTLSATFSGRTSVAPAGSPKKELLASAYVENGGPVDPSTWHYYTGLSATLVGDGDWAGALIELMRTGPAFQVGVGANNKNLNEGASGWFTWNVTQQPSTGSTLPATGQGDFNVQWTDCVAANQAPTASFTKSVNGLTVGVHDTSSDPDGQIVAWSWDFGDGGSSTDQNPTHTYSAAGGYTITLTVTDDGGATATTSMAVMVDDGPSGDHYSGHLSGSGDYDWQPNGTYYQTSTSGAHVGTLEGPASADFDLYLYKWNGSSWSLVARAETYSSSESINYNGSAGYYVWKVRSYSGSGSYDLWIDAP